MPDFAADLLLYSPQLLVAVIFLYAGFVKLWQGVDLRITVSQVGLLPKRVRESVIWLLLPWIELAVGGLLATQLFPVVTGIIALVLTLGFLAFHTYLVDIAPSSVDRSCNCFGNASRGNVSRRSQLGAGTLMLLSALNAAVAVQATNQTLPVPQHLFNAAIRIGLAVSLVVVVRFFAERRKEGRAKVARQPVRLHEKEYQT